MATTRLRVEVERLLVSRVAAMWGPGSWYVHATIDGADVGDRNRRQRVKKGEPLTLGGDWLSVVDVSGKAPGSTVVVKLEVFERTGAMRRQKSLGKIEYQIQYPFMTPQSDLRIDGSEVKQGKKMVSFYSASISVDCHTSATTAAGGPEVLVSRQPNGSTAFSTIAKVQVTPRVEICPVVPTPPRAFLPPFTPAAGLAAPKLTRWAEAVDITTDLPLNVLANPSLIPVLNESDPDLQKKAARIAVTYYHPGNLDTSKFCWVIKSGPIKFLGATTGIDVLALGLPAARKADVMAEVQLRWESDTGPVLATYRAWVGEPMEIPYRVNLIRGTTPGALLRTQPRHVPDQVEKANVHMWQSGLHFVPDPDRTCWDGATVGTRPSGSGPPEPVPGVFEISTADNKTLLFDPNIAPLEQNRWNFKPGVLQINYFKSFGGSGAGFYGFATDEPGSLAPHFVLDGAPSSSWRRKSGLPGDAPVEPVHMKTLPRTRPRGAARDRKSSAAVLADQQAKLAAIAATTPDKNAARMHAELAGDYAAVAKKIWEDEAAAAKEKRAIADAAKSTSVEALPPNVQPTQAQPANAQAAKDQAVKAPAAQAPVAKDQAAKEQAANTAEEAAAAAKVQADKAEAAAQRARASYGSIKAAGDPAPRATSVADRVKAEPDCDARITEDLDDAAYATGRKLTDSDMESLFALVQSDFAVPEHFDWGANIAHEAAHVLGLAHRGSGGNPRAQGNGFNGPSADGVNDPNGAGYPYDENVMGYTTLKCQDFDLIQTQVMREHPLCIRLSDKKPPAKPPAPAPKALPDAPGAAAPKPAAVKPLPKPPSN